MSDIENNKAVVRRYFDAFNAGDFNKLDDIVAQDYGDKLEVLNGLHEGDTIIPRPSDNVREGVKVQPVFADSRAAAK